MNEYRAFNVTHMYCNTDQATTRTEKLVRPPRGGYGVVIFRMASLVFGRYKYILCFWARQSGILSNVAAPPHMVPYVISMGKGAHTSPCEPKISHVG